MGRELACQLLKRDPLNMDSSRIRFYQGTPSACSIVALRPGGSLPSPRLSEMPAPGPIEPVTPDQVVVDIIVSTLSRVQRSANPDVAAAASRYLSSLR